MMAGRPDSCEVHTLPCRLATLSCVVQILEKIEISELVLTQGLRFGLDGSTASCRWSGLVPAAIDQGRLNAFQERAAQLCVPQCFFGADSMNWPADLLDGEHERYSLAAWGVALTVLFQRLARDPISRGKVVHESAASSLIAVPWEREQVVKGAIQLALKHILLWLRPEQEVQAQTRQLAASVQKWLDAVQPGGLSPNSQRFALAAKARSIPVQVINGILRLGQGANAEQLNSSFTGRTSNLAARMARNKMATSRVLFEGGVPVPASALASNLSDAKAFAQRLGWPVVIKPSNQDQGTAVTPDIGNDIALEQAFTTAAAFSPGAVIVEKHIPGNDYRMLVVGGHLLMTVRRIPGAVTGDGHRSIEQLVQETNLDSRRGDQSRSVMMRLKLDTEALSCMAEEGLSPESIPTVGRFIRLRRTANISTGGTAIDVSSEVHPNNRLLAERAARLVGLDVAGIDFLCPDISRSWKEVGGAVCEVNAQPGFRAHWLSNPSRDINGEIVDWLFRGRSARIPTTAISGTNGKSTTAQMLHRIWMEAGFRSGVCTTQGVWLDNDCIVDNNLSGYPGARIILNDPAVEAAVFEMPRKGLLRFGHPCDRYDVSALLNIQDDHIGTDDIESMEGMARLKAQVLQQATKAIVINADDKLCLAMRAYAVAHRHILVAQSEANEAMRAHLADGGTGVFIASVGGERWAVVAEGLRRVPLLAMCDAPAMLGGLAVHNESNAIFAIALAWAHGIDQEIIVRALKGFSSSLEMNPGRYNLMPGFPFQVLLDFAHNPDGVQAIADLARKWPVKGRRRLVFSQIGNRHRSHLAQCVRCLAQAFDDVHVSCDPGYLLKSKDWQSDDPVAMFLAEARTLLEEAGMESTHIATESNPEKAILEALRQTQSEDFLVILADPTLALPLLQARH